jgi:hypothetical protein
MPQDFDITLSAAIPLTEAQMKRIERLLASGDVTLTVSFKWLNIVRHSQARINVLGCSPTLRDITVSRSLCRFWK